MHNHNKKNDNNSIIHNNNNNAEKTFKIKMLDIFFTVVVI